MAARHFLERGFENFGFIANECYYSRLRLEGFAEELKAGGFSCDVLHHKALSEEYWAIDRDKTAKWLGKLTKPLAVLVAHDLYGMLVINLCRDLGLRVPDEVAIAGVDNDEAVCQLCSPPLSSVAVPTGRIGYEAAACLDRLMAGDKDVPMMQLIQPQGVVIRQSSDTVGVADDLVRASLRFIRENAAKPISVADVVATVPACRSIVERRFRAVLGRSPSQELWKTRIDMAKRMLTQTDLKVDDVAGKCGFAGYRTFYTVFRRQTGIAPAAYRKRAKRA
jgi:LacI family transcriptional regulator